MELREQPQRAKAAMRLEADLFALASLWPSPAGVDLKPLRGWEPLKELRRSYDGIAYRIFLAIKGRELWLLSMFEKRSKKTPRHELERAMKRWRALEAES